MKSKWNLLFTLFFLMPAVPSLAGKGAGGQFRFYRTAIHDSLQRSRFQLATELSLSPESLNLEKFSGQVDLKELGKIIDRLEIKLGEPVKTRKNPQGYEDVLMMDYRVKENGDKYIVALEPLFDHTLTLLSRQEPDTWYNKELFTYNQLDAYFRRLLVHEALHHFGDFEHDDDLAFQVSQVEAGLSGLNNWKVSKATKDSVFSWEPKYRQILAELSRWGRNRDINENTSKLTIPVNNDLTLIIDAREKGRIAYLENKPFKSLLKAKCKPVKSELGSAVCEFKRRIVDGKSKSTVKAERVNVFINNPTLGNEQYLDGVYKTERPLRLKYKYTINEDVVLKETNVPFFNLNEEK